MSALISRSRRRRALATACCFGALVAILPIAGATARTSVGVFPLLQPYRLGARASAAVSVHFFGGVAGVPAPLREVVLRLPAGLGVDVSSVSTCPIGSLRARGARGCSTSSLVGRGTATLKVHAGSQTLPESAAISVFRAPDRGGHLAFEIAAHGRTPLDETTVATAILLPDSSPYGSKLVVAVPPIPTLTFEPNASFSSLALTIGATPRAPHPIVIPRRCPRAGFAFAASFAFVGEASASESGRLPCP